MKGFLHLLILFFFLIWVIGRPTNNSFTCVCFKRKGNCQRICISLTHLQEEEYKRPISYGELYNKVHKRKDGQYVSNKAKSFSESYENAMTKKYGEDTSKHPIVDSDVWIKIGENRRGRIYGIGHSLDLEIIPHVSSSTVEGPSYQNQNPTSEEITTLTTQISNLQEQVKT